MSTYGSGLTYGEGDSYGKGSAYTYGSGVTYGSRYGGAAAGPTAVVVVDHTAGVVPLTVSFDGTGSTPTDTAIVSYVWDFGDGSSDTGAEVSHEYSTPGTYYATLTVTDEDGYVGVSPVTITITSHAANVPPVVSITPSAPSGTAPFEVTFTATATDPDGYVTGWLWNFGDGNTSTQQSPTHIYDDPGDYTARLVVTDDDGATRTTTYSIRVFPDLVTPGLPAPELPVYDACGDGIPDDVWDIAWATMRNSHKMQVRIMVAESDGGYLQFCDESWTTPPWYLTAGSVEETLDDQVSRTASMEVVADHWTSREAILTDLSPYKTMLRVERGVYTPVGIVYFPLGVYRLFDVNVANDRHASLTAYSQEADIRDHRFITPLGKTASAMQFQALLGPTGMIFGDMGPKAPTLEWVGDNMNSAAGKTKVLPSKTTLTDGRNRLELIMKLADSINADFYFDRMGVMTMRDKSDFTDPVKTRINAHRPGVPNPWPDPAVLVQFSKKYTRNQVYNAAVVSAADTGGKVSYRGIAYDTDPASPTRWGGPFGHKPRYYSSPFFKSNAQCVAYAQQLVKESNQLKSTLDFEFVPNPAIELGDVLELEYPDGSVEKHIVRTLTIGLTADSTMTSSTAADSDTQVEMQVM